MAGLHYQREGASRAHREVPSAVFETEDPEIPGKFAKDNSPKEMQVLSFHPGSIFTETVRRVMGDRLDDFDFDDECLCGHFAVRAASREAEFLHGRFVWAAWDVDELKRREIRKLIDEEPYYPQIGVKGLT
ncbi:hypothetical protein Daesc_009786 [Daldinia eschscholtzii]|uniref:Uncharacterized protein n=1 Tax=Daldinia eschscholtzii TaxID=292717 RepID=A0AAX6MBX6_9PEZI